MTQAAINKQQTNLVSKVKIPGSGSLRRNSYWTHKWKTMRAHVNWTNGFRKDLRTLERVQTHSDAVAAQVQDLPGGKALIEKADNYVDMAAYKLFTASSIEPKQFKIAVTRAENSIKTKTNRWTKINRIAGVAILGLGITTGVAAAIGTTATFLPAAIIGGVGIGLILTGRKIAKGFYYKSSRAVKWANKAGLLELTERVERVQASLKAQKQVGETAGPESPALM